MDMRLRQWSERDDIPGAAGHHLPNNQEGDENLGEELVSGGIEEAAHDQMVEARREELEQERKQLQEDEQTLMDQMREMEVSMAKERADMARQRNDLADRARA